MTKYICDVCGRETDKFETSNATAKVRFLFERDGKPVKDICQTCTKAGKAIVAEEVDRAIVAAKARMAKMFHDAAKVGVSEQAEKEPALRRSYTHGR